MRRETIGSSPTLVSTVSGAGTAAISRRAESHRPLVDPVGVSQKPYQQAAKRTADVVLSLLLLLVLAPVLLVLAVAVRLSSPGPVIFRQVRTGRGRRPFTIYKFRTMTAGSDALILDLRDRSDVDGPLFKIRCDPRRTPLGAVLRKLSLDELPQLWNVVKGDMSLVGPRPFVPSESAAFTGEAGRRFDVRPGMTGLWQVSGRNNVPFEELKRLDHSYVSDWSLWRDVQILAVTPFKVVRREGAY